MGELSRVMLVDDEQNLLSGIKRQLHGRYELTTATSGQEALAHISEDAPFAVVVSDMRMPGMDGVELLSSISDKAPMTVRIMLTGNADQETAVKAINNGQIYRFFNKPCDAVTLSRGIDEGITQYRLQLAEKDLIETTLAGSVKLLSDILGMTHPQASRKRDKMRKWARKVAREMKIAKAWELDLAVMLGHIGILGVAPSVLEKIETRRDLRPEEQELYASIPKLGAELVGNIPRLENVGRAILYQAKNFDGSGFPADGVAGRDIPLVARVLKVLNEVAELTGGNEPGPMTFAMIRENAGQFDAHILDAAEQLLVVENAHESAEGEQMISEYVPIKLLKSGVTLLSDITYPDGHLILSKGCQLSDVQVQRLQGIHKAKAVSEPIHIAYPVQD